MLRSDFWMGARAALLAAALSAAIPSAVAAQVAGAPAHMGETRGPTASPQDVVAARLAARDRRDSRMLIAAGLGLVVSSAIHAAIFARRRICGRPDEPRYRVPTFSAPVTAGVGLTFTLAGGIRLLRQNRRALHPPSRAQYAGLTAFAFGMAAASQFVMLTALLPESEMCNS